MGKLILLWMLFAAQWTPSTDRRDPSIILEGNWQSCLGGGGYGEQNEYSERVYEHLVWAGVGPHHIAWELHLGPRNEFAVFKGSHPEHLEHDSPANLLTAFRYNDLDMATGMGREWTFVVERRLYHLSVKLAGGSRDECESFWIKLDRVDK